MRPPESEPQWRSWLRAAVILAARPVPSAMTESHGDHATSPSIAEFFATRNVFVTGVTGFVGKVSALRSSASSPFSGYVSSGSKVVS